MESFTTTILKFAKNGDKTGWTYILVHAEISAKIFPGRKLGYSIKGSIDNYAFKALNLLPMGEGDFILALNATIRKAIGKTKGETVNLKLAVDETPYQINNDFLECLADAPKAMAVFEKMTPSGQKYYSKWIESAKTAETMAKRIAQSIIGIADGLDFGGLLRRTRDEKNSLGK